MHGSPMPQLLRLMAGRGDPCNGCPVLTGPLLGSGVPAGGAGALLDVVRLAATPPADGVGLVAALACEREEGP